MQMSVKKWENSAAVRIPAQIIETTHLEIDQEVNVREEGGGIIIEPLKKLEYNLDDLVAQITPENCHEEIDFGSPLGEEVW